MEESSPLDPAALVERLRTEHQDARAFVDALLAQFDTSWTGELRGWGPVAEEALRVSREIGYDRGIALALLAAGFVHYLWQRNQEALVLMLEAKPALDEMEDVLPRIKCASGLAGLNTTMGNYQKALELGHDALNWMTQLESSEWQGWPHYLVGDAYRAAGDLDRSREHYAKAHEIFVGQGIQAGIARALIGLGGVCRDQGDLEASEGYFTAARTLVEKRDDAFQKARILSDLALIRQLRGNHDEALSLFEESLLIRREQCGDLPTATCLTDMGRLLLEIDRSDEAVEMFAEALELSTAHDHKLRMYDAHEALSEAYARKRDLDKALFHHKEFQRIKEDVLAADMKTRLRNLEISLEAAAAQKESELMKTHNDELRSKNAELARLLQELRDTQEMLIQSEKMASLGTLTAGIAHEMRNPLNFVNNFSAMTKDLAEELSDAISLHRDEPLRVIEPDILELLSEITANVDRIHEHGQRAGRIVNGMMVHSRQSGGKKSEVDVNELVSTNVDLAYHSFLANNDDPDLEIEVVLDLSDDAGTFNVVEDEMARVLTNIMNNALYALREHAKLRAGTSGYAELGLRILVQTVCRNGMVEISIADNGPGIDDDRKRKVFEPFYTTKPTGSGTGLGLSQSYEIITEHHGGTLKVIDTEGGGATIVVAVA